MSGTSNVSVVRGRAGKSLDRQGRKQDTKTKLGIYSTYSSRRSIHFLARCFNICKPLEKFGILSVQPGLYGSNDIRVGRKMANIVFSIQGKGGIPLGHIRRIGWVIKTMEAQVGQYLLGCKCPVSRGILLEEKHPLHDHHAARRFPSKCPSIAPAEMSNTPC